MNLNRGISTTLAITIIVVLAIIVGGGIFAYQYYYREKPLVELPKIETPKDETAGWNTYKNETYEIKYPSDWSFVDNQGTPRFFPNVYKNDSLKCYGGTSIGNCRVSGIAITIRPYNEVEYYWMWEAIENKPNINPPTKTTFDDSIKKSEFYIGNQKVTEGIYFGQVWQENYYLMDFSKKQAIVIFFGENNKNPISVMNVLEDMLPTFKFAK